MNIKSNTIWILFFFFSALIIFSTPKIISWKNAHKYYGKYVTVEGKIVDSYNSGKACFLNFHPNWKKHFTAVIFKSDFYKFPASPQDHYLNKKVQVTGLIEKYKGKPQIILKSQKQIKIIQKHLP